MADDPPPPGRPPFDPLPGWPERPNPELAPERPPAGGAAGPGRPPSAPPPGWTGTTPPWAQPAPSAPATPRPEGATSRPGRLAALRSGRGLAVVAAVVVLLVAGAITVAVVSGGDDSGGTGGPGGAPGRGGRSGVKAPPAAAGTDIPLLDGRLVVVARPGWEKLDGTSDTASVRLALAEATGRELLATLVVTALPGGGGVESLLKVDGGTRFEVATGSGPLQATAVPGISARVVSGAVRGSTTFFFSLSVSDAAGTEVDAALVQKLFVEQVAPQLRIP